MILQTSTGPQLGEILEFLYKFKNKPEFQALAEELYAHLERCFPPEKGKCMLSLTKGHLWSAFHQLRLSGHPKEAWHRLMSQAQLPLHLKQHTDKCFQLIIDRLLKHMVQAMKSELHTTPRSVELSVREDNVVYYMSGFVAFKLMKKYCKSTTDPELQSKWKFYVSILEKMKAE